MSKPNVRSSYLLGVNKYAGKKAMMLVDQGAKGSSPAVECPVTLLDVRVMYGRVEVLAKPHCGTGSIWVKERRVRVVKEFPHAENCAVPPHALAGLAARRGGAAAKASGADRGRDGAGGGAVRKAGKREPAGAGNPGDGQA